MIPGILLGVGFGLLCVYIENHWHDIEAWFEEQPEEPFEYRDDRPRTVQRPSGCECRV